jgi:drug/metabolite transporter (DMT)-like permease
MSRTFANFLLVVAAICWGTGNVAQQTVLEHIGPFLTTALKSLIAAIVILPFCLRPEIARTALNRSAMLLGFTVVSSFAVATILMQIAYGLTTVTNAGFLINTATVLTPIIAWVFLGHQPSNTIWFAAFVTLIGALLMGGGHIGTMTAGDLLCLAAAVCFAIWMISLGAFVMRYGRSGLVTLAQFVATSMICTPLALTFETSSLSSIYVAMPELFYIGIVSTGCAYFLQAIAQRHTSSCEAAVIVSAEAIFGAATAMLILSEQLNTQRATGAFLIIASIILVQLPTKRKTELSSNTIDLPLLTPGE